MPILRPCAAAAWLWAGATGAQELVTLGAPAPLKLLDGDRGYGRRGDVPPVVRRGDYFPADRPHEAAEPIRQVGFRDTHELGAQDLDDAIPGFRTGDAANAPPVYDRYNTLGSANRPLRFDYTLLGRGGVQAPDGGAVLMHEFSGRYQLRVPFGPSGSLRLQPFANITFLQGPNGTALELPGHLYKLAVDAQLDWRAGENWLLSVAVTPGFWTDLSTPGFRLPVRALAAYKVHEGLYFGGGVIYTDNYFHALLPTLGILWDINDRVRLELVAPRGRVIYMLHEDFQFYAGLEGGGDTYKIKSLGEKARMQYRDLRFLIGAELAATRGVSVLVEAGYAFYRKIRVENQEERNLDSGVFARFGARF